MNRHENIKELEQGVGLRSQLGSPGKQHVAPLAVAPIFIGTASCTRRVDLERFINCGDGFHPALKFAREISATCVYFLDTSVSINGDALTTSVSYTLTDSHSFPPPTLTNHT